MIYIFFYKIICILSGLLIIFLGYKLFIKGIFTESGEIESNWKDIKLIVKKAAPGTYFVLFGSIIVGMTVFKGFSTEEFSGHLGPGIHQINHPTDSLSVDKDTIRIK